MAVPGFFEITLAGCRLPQKQVKLVRSIRNFFIVVPGLSGRSLQFPQQSALTAMQRTLYVRPVGPHCWQCTERCRRSARKQTQIPGAQLAPPFG